MCHYNNIIILVALTYLWDVINVFHFIYPFHWTTNTHGIETLQVGIETHMTWNGDTPVLLGQRRASSSNLIPFSTLIFTA